MWNPQTYLSFADERSRPFFDLLARVGAERPRRVVDLGCGPGNLTEELIRRWPAAVVEAVVAAAAAVVVGSFVIVFDPIFQGLALAMMFGEIASTTLSRVTIPILYYLVQSWKERHQSNETGEIL